MHSLGFAMCRLGGRIYCARYFIIHALSYRYIMARTKQTARKSENTTPTRGRKRTVTTEESSSDYYSPLSSPERSEGGVPLAKFPRKNTSPAKSPARAGPSRGASRSSPARVNVPVRRSPRKNPTYGLPSFSTEDDDEDDEVTFKVTGGPSDGGAKNMAGGGTTPGTGTGSHPRRTVASKSLKRVRALQGLIHGPKRGESSLKAIRKWNNDGCRKVPNETKRGWLKKGTRARDGRGRLLRQLKPGTYALREIRFYQRSRVFLIPMLAFQRFVREVCIDVAKSFRWQAIALYHLQVAAKAYLVGVLADTNLCAIHRKCMTIFPKDLHLARRLRGKSETGVGANMSDQFN